MKYSEKYLKLENTRRERGTVKMSIFGRILKDRGPQLKKDEICN